MMEHKTKLVICGAGGHARSVLDIALQNDNFDIIGCVDPAYPKISELPLMNEIPVIGCDGDLPKLYAEGIRHIFFALGDNRLRKKLYMQAMEIGFEAVNIISRHAIISPKAKLGKGNCIMAGAVVNVNSLIGDNCIINTNCSIDHDCVIGSHSHVAPGVAMSGCVTIGEGVHIGTGTSVIDKIHIGKWAYIGAGSAVIGDIGEGMLAYGVPAREMKKL